MNKKRNYGRKSLDFIKLRLRLKRDQDNYISPKIILIYKYVLVIGASFCILFFTDYFTKAHEIKTGYQAAADIALTNDEQFLMVPDMKAGELDFIPLTTAE